MYFDSSVFCNPHYYLTPSVRLPGNPEKVYDGLLGLEGLILVGDMTDGRRRRAEVMEDVLSWRRGTDGGGLIRLPPPSFIPPPAPVFPSVSLFPLAMP